VADDALQARLDRFIDERGSWRSNIYLRDGIWTIADRRVSDSGLRRTLQVTADLARAPLETLRVIDLACEEGAVGIELARQGAHVVGVEGREVHVARARFVKEALGLDDYEVVHDDVRNVTADKYGEFDVVLCLGILYHLDAPDVFEFVDQLGRMCKGLMILNTQFSLAAKTSHAFRDERYWGRRFSEHRPRSRPEERAASLRSSLDNTESFWLTLPSLYNLLARAGFTSVLESRIPRPRERARDRVMLAAIKGERQEVISMPDIDDASAQWPEREKHLPTVQSARGEMKRIARRIGLADVRHRLWRS
jgi:Methyltransferase domain